MLRWADGTNPTTTWMEPASGIIEMPEEVRMAVTDRAYTSPIWHTPQTSRPRAVRFESHRGVGKRSATEASARP